MSISEYKDVGKTLAKPGVHQQWENDYRTAENQKFYEEALNYITDTLNAPKNSIILDAGCGPCAYSIFLANHGFSVVAVDFSESALKRARFAVQDSGLQERIKLRSENLLSLSFADESFDYILCWGVLMHIPDLEKTISELTRVMKKNGVLVISEGNMYSVQSILLRNLKRFFGAGKSVLIKTAAGLEIWEETYSGKLLTREANIRWLIDKFKSNGFVVKKHVAGQFTELYTRFSLRLAKYLIHAFNHFWFRYIRIPCLAQGNIIILQKKK